MFRNAPPHHPGRRRQGRRGGAAPRHRASAKAGDALPDLRTLLHRLARRPDLVGAKHLGAGPRAALWRPSSTPAGPVGGITVRAPSQQDLHGHLPRPGRPRRGGAGERPQRHPGRCQGHRGHASGTARRGDQREHRRHPAGEWRPTSSPSSARSGASVAATTTRSWPRHRGGHGRRPAGGRGRSVGVDVDIESGPRVPRLRADAAARRWCGSARRPSPRSGSSRVMQTGGGGSDANILNARGLPTVNLDAGMMQVHSPRRVRDPGRPGAALLLWSLQLIVAGPRSSRVLRRSGQGLSGRRST